MRFGVGLDIPELTWSASIGPIFSSYHNTLTLKTTVSFKNQTETMTLIAICAHLLILLKVVVWDGGLSGVAGAVFI